MTTYIDAAIAEYHFLKDQLAVCAQGLAENAIDDEDVADPGDELEERRVLIRMYLIETNMKTLERSIANDLQYVSLTNFKL